MIVEARQKEDQEVREPSLDIFENAASTENFSWSVPPVDEGLQTVVNADDAEEWPDAACCPPHDNFTGCGILTLNPVRNIRAQKHISQT